MSTSPPPNNTETTADCKASSDGWIKCSERLPEFKDEVLVWSISVGRVSGSLFHCNYNVHDWEIVCGYGLFKLDEVTHWRELPAGPK